ncbi:hypothetical protein FGO68_gene16953 [Halteria grandinella]|uniref:Uncharacterized protein n=1 Tax=Halteria grandinella TaxID=5974 RepID=A0A8J8NXX0_HALGN|nr:hypothetical protein FGO68_gene16953 [Halteria grandinella]
MQLQQSRSLSVVNAQRSQELLITLHNWIVNKLLSYKINREINLKNSSIAIQQHESILLAITYLSLLLKRKSGNSSIFIIWINKQVSNQTLPFTKLRNYLEGSLRDPSNDLKRNIYYPKMKLRQTLTCVFNIQTQKLTIQGQIVSHWQCSH